MTHLGNRTRDLPACSTVPSATLADCKERGMTQDHSNGVWECLCLNHLLVDGYLHFVILLQAAKRNGVAVFATRRFLLPETSALCPESEDTCDVRGAGVFWWPTHHCDALPSVI
jgi:hypothetical protein